MMDRIARPPAAVRLLEQMCQINLFEDKFKLNGFFPRLENTFSS